MEEEEKEVIVEEDRINILENAIQDLILLVAEMIGGGK